MLEKTFEAADVEPRIARAWEDAKAFAAGAGKEPGKGTFTIVIPPPNVTGSLHMGPAPRSSSTAARSAAPSSSSASGSGRPSRAAPSSGS